MGETGCGKTRLIEFMSKLQVPTELKEELKTMVIVKVRTNYPSTSQSSLRSANGSELDGVMDSN